MGALVSRVSLSVMVTPRLAHHTPGPQRHSRKTGTIRFQSYQYIYYNAYFNTGAYGHTSLSLPPVKMTNEKSELHYRRKASPPSISQGYGDAEAFAVGFANYPATLFDILVA